MLRNEASLQVAYSSFSQRIDKARKEFSYWKITHNAVMLRSSAWQTSRKQIFVKVTSQNNTNWIKFIKMKLTTELILSTQ